MSGLLSQFTEFAKTPEGQGLLSAAFGGLATAQRGAPLNSIGRAGMAGLAGYANAQDRVQQQADSAFQQQYRAMQMDAMKQQQDKAKAEQAWRGKLPELMTPKLQGQTEQARILADQMGPDASPEDVQAMNAGARMPATGLEYGMDKTALQRHLMDPSSPFADKALEQLFYPKSDDYKVVGTDLVKIGPTGVSVAHQSQRPESLPSDVKAYNIAVSQGYSGTLMDFMRDRVSNTEGAKAAYDLVTMTTTDGKTYMVPRSRLISGGQSAPAPSAPPSPRPGAPARTQPPGNYRGSGYNGGSSAAAAGDTVAILNKELATAEANGNKTDAAAIRREIARVTGGSTPPGGVQVQGEAEKQGAIAAAKAAAEAASPASVAAKAAQRDSIRAQISVIDKALNHPGRKTATGLSGAVDPRNYIPGTDARDFRVVLDQLGGAAFLQAFESLKGGGAITEVEGNKATAAIARLNRAQSDKEFETALNDLRDVMNRGLSRLGGAGASGGWDAPAGAKQVKRTGMYGGRKVIEYTDGSMTYAD
jgi:hypothetical protein